MLFRRANSEPVAGSYRWRVAGLIALPYFSSSIFPDSGAPHARSGSERERRPIELSAYVGVAGLRIGLARIEAIRSGFQFADHGWLLPEGSQWLGCETSIRVPEQESLCAIATIPKARVCRSSSTPPPMANSRRCHWLPCIAR